MPFSPCPILLPPFHPSFCPANRRLGPPDLPLQARKGPLAFLSLPRAEPVRESAAPFVSAVTATAAEGNLGRGSSHSQFAHPFTIAFAASADLCGE